MVPGRVRYEGAMVLGRVRYGPRTEGRGAGDNGRRCSGSTAPSWPPSVQWTSKKTARSPSRYSSYPLPTPSPVARCRELAKGLKGLDVTVAPAERAAILAYADRDQSGSIEFNEFRRLFANLHQQLPDMDAFLANRNPPGLGHV
eukprot:3550598-Rhodomonas_salina.1